MPKRKNVQQPSSPKRRKLSEDEARALVKKKVNVSPKASQSETQGSAPATDAKGSQSSSQSTEVIKADPSSSGKRKALIVSDQQEVRTFNKDNPAFFPGSQEFDWEDHDRRQNEKLVLERMQKSVLNEKLSRRESHNEQAFNIFQIPIKMDTRFLSLKDLQAELKARFLPHTGTKELLRQRLEAAIKAEEQKNRKETL